jgi:hypothetical protein
MNDSKGSPQRSLFRLKSSTANKLLPCFAAAFLAGTANMASAGPPAAPQLPAISTISQGPSLDSLPQMGSPSDITAPAVNLPVGSLLPSVVGVVGDALPVAQRLLVGVNLPVGNLLPGAVQVVGEVLPVADRLLVGVNLPVGSLLPGVVQITGDVLPVATLLVEGKVGAAVGDLATEALPGVVNELGTTVLPTTLNIVATDLVPSTLAIVGNLAPTVVVLVSEVGPILGTVGGTVLPVAVSLVGDTVPAVATIAGNLVPTVVVLVQQTGPILNEVGGSLLPGLAGVAASAVPVGT